jgi:hypothetical protein
MFVTQLQGNPDQGFIAAGGFQQLKAKPFKAAADDAACRMATGMLSW